MKNLILAASALMFLTACDPFEGIFAVTEAFTIKSKENNKIVNVTLQIGTVSAKFEFPSKKELMIKTVIAGKKKTLKLILPKKLAVPDNGDFSITAADLGQDFGANGQSQTNVSDGGIQQGYESCTYQRREYRCFVGPTGQTICQEYWNTVNGRSYTEYFIRNTHKVIKVNFEKENNVLATFSGEKTSTEKIIRHQDQCF